MSQDNKMQHAPPNHKTPLPAKNDFYLQSQQAMLSIILGVQKSL